MVCTSCIRGTILTNGARIVIFLFHEEDKDERKRYEKRYGIRFKFIVDSKLFELFILEVRFPRQSMDFFFLSLSLLYRINGIRIVFFFFLEIFHRFLLQKKRDWYERFNSGGKKKSELFNIFGYFIVESIFIRREN